MPNLNRQFLCASCKATHDIKYCPSCEQPAVLVDGCNHVTCVCGTHWCFKCGGKYAREDIYHHMDSVHGGRYG